MEGRGKSQLDLPPESTDLMEDGVKQAGKKGRLREGVGVVPLPRHPSMFPEAGTPDRIADRRTQKLYMVNSLDHSLVLW